MIVKPHKMPSNKEQNNGKRANTNKGPAKGSKSLLILFSENYTRVVVLVKKTQGYEKKIFFQLSNSSRPVFLLENPTHWGFETGMCSIFVKPALDIFVVCSLGT